MPIGAAADREQYAVGPPSVTRRTLELWRSTVTHMNNVKIVAASLQVTSSQVKECFLELIEKTRKILLSISISKRN